MTFNQALRHVAVGAAAGLAWSLAYGVLPVWIYPFIAPFVALYAFVFIAEVYPAEMKYRTAP